MGDKKASAKAGRNKAKCLRYALRSTAERNRVRRIIRDRSRRFARADLPYLSAGQQQAAQERGLWLREEGQG